MPGFNKTGPTGQGPQTGRGLGMCDSEATTKELYTRNFGNSYGVGQGGQPRGGGRGRCFGGGQRGRGMGGRNFSNDEVRRNVNLADQIAQLLKENEELRSRLLELESKEQE